MLKDQMWDMRESGGGGRVLGQSNGKTELP